MNVKESNVLLLQGKIDNPALFPKLKLLENQQYVFDTEIGLERLPEEGGLITIRGSRQYGKSTYLEKQLKETIEEYGLGSAIHLNGDEILTYKDLIELLEEFLPLLNNKNVKRIFIDEITAIDDWQRGIKILADKGVLEDVLVVTTGSKAIDLHRGEELLPGRKGKLARTKYIFPPISYADFLRQAQTSDLDSRKYLQLYLLSGGSPIAANELLCLETLPEYVIEIVKDWVYGEFARAGRNRAALLAVLNSIIKFGGSAVGYNKLARESGLANNTLASEYVALLSDLFAVSQCQQWDHNTGNILFRKPCKFHFTNLLLAVAWHPERIRQLQNFHLFSNSIGSLYEWLVAQEIYRRQAIAGDEIPEQLKFWKSKDHEIDFVYKDFFIEVKSGQTSPQEFLWFSKVFHGAQLIVVSDSQYVLGNIKGITHEEFLLRQE